MNDVAKYYTPLTPDLQRWDKIASQHDFKYLAVLGTRLVSAVNADKANQENAEIIDAKISALRIEIQKTEQNIELLEKQSSAAPYGKKKHVSSKIKIEKAAIKVAKKNIAELKRDRSMLGTLPMSIDIAAQLIADDMPQGREVFRSTIRQDFYHSKKLAEKADFEAHLKV
jgi:hypothetical protein